MPAFDLNPPLDRLGVKDGTLLVAVSGGRDSMALLHALRQVAPHRHLQLIVAHLNHGLRGAASADDQAFVQDYCLAHGLPLRTTTLTAEDLADLPKTNLEAQARRLRYRWLFQQACAVGAAWVATAHHADDQAETVLHHLLRGSHRRGLCGIAFRKKLGDGLTLIRPLLHITRAQIDQAVGEWRLPSREDATNADVRLTRNFLRRDVLAPLKARFGPKAIHNLADLAAWARQDSRRQARRARRLLAEAERPRVGPLVILAAEPLRGARSETVRELFVLLWRREGWPRDAMTRRHWQALAAFVNGERRGLELPGRVRVDRRGGVLQVGKLPDG